MVSPDTANLVWSSQPAATTELVNSMRYRTKFDLTNASQARVVVYVVGAGAATAQLCAQYSTDQVTWSDLDGSGTPCTTINATGVQVSEFVNLAAAARADVFLRIIGKNGNGTKSPSFGQIAIQVK
jgi:hypothetical protein